MASRQAIARLPNGQYQKGQSGNPPGPALKDRQLTSALIQFLSRTEDGRPRYEILPEKLWELIFDKTCSHATRLAAIEYIYARTDGHPTQHHRFSYEDARREAERIAEQYGVEGGADAVLNQAERLRVVK